MSVETLPSQEFFVGLGGLLTFGAALWRARIRGVQIRVVVAAFGLCGVGAVLGARIAWGILHQRGGVATGTPWWGWIDPRVGGFASLGAVAGAGVVLAGLRGFLEASEHWRLADVLVPAGLLGFGLARLGCLSAGCDFGAVADLAWSVQYPEGTAAWRAHLDLGLIGPEADWSALVHPFPLYDIAVILGAVAIGGLAAKHDGAEAAVAGASYLSGRFVIEWFRAPVGREPLGAELNPNQWFVLTLLPPLCWCVWTRYRGQ